MGLALGGLAAWLSFAPTGGAAEEKTITIREPFGLAWGPDRVNYRVEFPQGTVAPDGVALTDAAGAAVPVQLSAVELWPDGKTVKRATASFMVTLAPDQTATWKLRGDRAAVKPSATDLVARATDTQIELTNGLTGVRLVGGARTFDPPAAAADVPAPLQGVRLPGGAWVGRGWWQTDVACTGYRAELTATGPVFAQARLRYEFAGGRSYTATVELAAGQDLAVITEEADLSVGQRYPMSGVDGMKPEERYAYVPPKFASPDAALIWDWWGQTMAVLPTPNAYCFSFYEGLRPDSADYNGRSNYGNLKPGDGGLKYDKDGRFAYLNAFLQWGDEESTYFGFYRADAPAAQLAFVGLRPSQWLHPDIDPHPSTLLKQYVQTNCLTFERRTAGEAFMRAPVCLGRRVYGVGGVKRTLARQVLPERGGPKLTETEVWGSNLMLRHVRYGSVELDRVRDWVLDYDEPSKYPRLYVPAGDRARYESRRTRKPMEDVAKELAARTGPTPAEQKAVPDALARLRQMVQHFAQVAYGNMDFGINEGLMADFAEDALASPAITPEQAREVRRWLAALVYQALNPDFAPPRAAGFAWGSANMMAQVQCRACYLAGLLPNHPAGPVWRATLAHAVTLYVEDQINEAGATLECPHYGSMAIMMPAHALLALANCGGVDLTRAEKRLRAAAHHRLATLSPYDVRGGFRPVTPEGDGYYEGDPTLAPLAGFFQQRDPALAAQLAWGVRESNNTLGGHSDPSYKTFDVGLAPAEPVFGSAHFPGYGVLMRRGAPARDETFALVYAGGFSWGHGHNDRGSFVLYSKGAPLMVDFAAMYTPSMREQWLHAGGLTFNHDETVRPAGNDPKDKWWRESPSYKEFATAPFTAVEMRADPNAKDGFGTFGLVTAWQPGAVADYTRLERQISYLHRVAYALPEPHGKMLFDDGVPHEEIWLKEPFRWTRQVLLVKDDTDAGNDFLVVRDDLSGNRELDAALNLWCLADKLAVAGPTGRYTGQHGVDLHVYVAEPTEFTYKTRTVGHPCGFGFQQYYQKTFKKPFREDMIQMQIPAARRGGGYFVVLVPAKADAPAPMFETLAGGAAVRVTYPERSDVVVLRPGAAAATAGVVAVEGHNLGGPAWLLRTRAGKTTVYEFSATPAAKQ